MLRNVLRRRPRRRPLAVGLGVALVAGAAVAVPLTGALADDTGTDRTGTVCRPAPDGSEICLRPLTGIPVTGIPATVRERLAAGHRATYGTRAAAEPPGNGGSSGGGGASGDWGTERAKCLTVATGWSITRFHACRLSAWELTNHRTILGIKQLVLRVEFVTEENIELDFDSDQWQQSLDITTLRTWGNDGASGADSLTVDVRSACDGCESTVVGGGGPQRVTVEQDISVEVEAQSDVSAGAVLESRSWWEATFRSKNAPTAWTTLPSPIVRCDAKGTGSAPEGCVVKDVKPTLVLRGGAFAEVTRHVARAQQSGLPGAPGGAPLTRTTDAGRQDDNRARACPQNLPRPAGKSCDEYPFASTRQGAASGGQPRVFEGCGLPTVEESGTAGFSRCMVDAKHNESAGNYLAAFYARYRIIDGDDFFVEPAAG